MYTYIYIYIQNKRINNKKTGEKQQNTHIHTTRVTYIHTKAQQKCTYIL